MDLAEVAGVLGDDAPEQIRNRMAKRERLLAEGTDPYPAEVPITATIPQVREKYANLEPGEELTETDIGIAGRVMLQRSGGKIAFATLQDGPGNRIQVLLSLANVGKERLDDFKHDVDLGDFIFVRGYAGASKRGELSIFAREWQMASKAIRPLPKVYKNEAGEDVSLSEESRVRLRHLDLITRPQARDMVRLRAGVMKSLRANFDRRGYTEIETPILQTLHGGASARPFVTHINAYDQDLYLRIATELYLKRAVVGGIDRVFEIGRNFRNEGADSTHSPEFTSLECYEAYATYDVMADLTQDLVQQAALDTLGTLQVTLADGTEYDLSGQWRKIDLYETVSQCLGEEVTVETPRKTLEKYAEKHDISVAPYWVPGKIVEELFEELYGDQLYEPTFVYDFPEDTSPLTRPHRTKPGVTEKWDLYVRGMELGTAYSELADPVIQRQRLTQQSLEAAKGDPEAMQLDEDFIEALEQGFPPTGGMGMGIDRLLTAFTGLGIRETITFPFIKPSA
ncbi:lysine--tRNA ligase [Actinobaculum suis]|uniref:lysine--tRNA ligase n=1 Tax=Actinobaculum suis TaxID=1657 RepID=UPI0008086BB5|nr:lysine--tRNA ligase [Actinobaculum suis]OCA94656.1 lysine--tRNA ligase [Actinobaculum suis]OCA95024.1 lysine--tRNA ligase [Actinobaculum suis]